MRVLIASDTRLDADVVCTSSREAKKVINEEHITTLFLSQKINGRERGIDVLHWAESKGLLPGRIVLIDSSLADCNELGMFLRAKRFRGLDARTFIRIVH